MYEARTGAHEPFLHSNFTSNINLTSESFFVSFRHSSAIYAHYDCCEECTPWIYTRISGKFHELAFYFMEICWVLVVAVCKPYLILFNRIFVGCSKYSARTASAESEMTYPLRANQSSNRTDYILFTQNIVVNHDGNPTFGAKIIFSESENLRRSRYEIGRETKTHTTIFMLIFSKMHTDLSNTPSIFHYVNSSSHYTKSLTGLPLKQAYTWPFIVNITITNGKSISNKSCSILFNSHF